MTAPTLILAKSFPRIKPNLNSRRIASTNPEMPLASLKKVLEEDPSIITLPSGVLISM
jgi:hypothetical protein